MKKVLLSLMAIAVALVSCKKEEQIVPEIKADKTEVTVPTAGTEDEDVFIEFESNVEWTAALKEAIDWGSITPAKGVAGKGKIKIIADANQGNDARTAVVVVTAGSAQKEFTVTQLQKDAFSLVAEAAEVGAEGGEVEIKVMTNIAYEVVLPDGASWVKLATTKAYGEQVTKVTVEAFDELDGEREAVLTVKAAGFEGQEFTITQNGPKSKLWGIDLRTVINRSPSVELGDIASYTSVVSIAVLGDKLVVCQGDGSAPVLLDKKTGENKGKLNTGDVKVYAVTNDDAGHLILSNRNAYDPSTYSWTAAFQAYYMTSETSTPVQFVNGAKYGPAGSVIIARGDVTKNGLFVTPYEGIPDFSAANGIGYWTIKDGVVSAAETLNLTGFVGLGWANGYWNMAPNNIPALGFLSTDLSAGGLMGVYDENKLYMFNAEGACTLVSQDAAADSNHSLNSMDIRYIHGKTYGAACAAPFFPQWGLTAIVAVSDLSNGNVVFTADTAAYPQEEETLNDAGASSDIIIEAAEGGLNLYYIDNNSSAIEAFWCPLK